MDELFAMLRSGPDAPAPPRVRPFAPQTFRDTLQAIVGPIHVRESRIPALSGATGQVADLPGMRRRIMLDDSAAGSRQILAHEAGHVLDFSDPQGEALRTALGLDREEFAELFADALLDPPIRAGVSGDKQQVRDFIQQRLAQQQAEAEQAMAAPADAVAVRAPVANLGMGPSRGVGERSRVLREGVKTMARDRRAATEQQLNAGMRRRSMLNLLVDRGLLPEDRRPPHGILGG